jgi:outer membrane autotransporter protein
MGLRAWQIRFFVLPAGMALLALWLSAPAYAQDATWAGPGNSWNAAANWSPGTQVPSNTATFAGASPTSVVVPAVTTINTIEFTAAAPAYSFTIQNELEIFGSGIINGSANAPSFSTNTGASLFFFNSSTAANAVLTNNGTLAFFDSSTAGTATITTNGLMQFLNTSSADHATITINGGGSLGFRNTSTAATATIVNNGAIDFLDSSTAGNAVVTTNSGATTFFQASASGGQAQFITNAGGTFDISGLTDGGMTAGSIAGAGNYVLGTNTLTVGGNDLSTEVSGVISGSGGSLVKVGTGTLTLAGANTYGGATIVETGVLAAGATNTFSPNSAVTVASGATLELNGFNQTIPGLTNAGLVNMGIGTPPGTLLATTNYIGNGGTIAMNTFLGTDGSPSDKLVINAGTATGSSFIHITNAGGPGEQTNGNGILVVQATNGGSTAGANFALNGEVRAGFFDYDLFHGGMNGTNPNDWFLRSTFIGPEGPGTGEPEPPVEPPPSVLPPGVFPIIGPELATYGVVQPLARQLGLTTLGTLHERIGDTLTAANVAPSSLASGVDPSVWGRVFGQQIKNHYEAFADPRADGSLIGFQSGFDLFRGSILPIDGHRDAAGLYFAYGNAAVDVNGLVTNAAATNYVLTKTGTVNFNAYTMGGYWTHYGPTDWYVDAVVQGTFYQGDATTQFASLPINGTGFASSLEAGYPVPLPLGPRFVLEPEAQIIWQRVSFDDANDGLGPVALGDTSGASGRIGLRGQWTIVTGQPVQPQTFQKMPQKAPQLPQLLWSQVWQPYVTADLWRDWGADAATAFAGEPVPLISHATRLDLAAGLTARLSANVSLYGQAGYQFAVGDTDGGQRDGVKGDLGLRVTW